MEESRGFEGDEESEQHHRRDAENNDREGEKPDREKHFAKMKSRGGTNVEIEVGVMNVVKPPEERDHVIGPMPPPISVVHEQKSCGHCDPARRLEPIEQTDMSILRPDGDSQRDWQHGEPNDRKSRNRQNPIANKSTNHAEMLASQRKTPLQKKQREKDAAKQRTADVIHQRKFR